MNFEEDLVTIHKYLTGQLSSAEAEAFEARIAGDEELRSAVEETRIALDASKLYQSPVWDEESALESMPFAPASASESTSATPTHSRSLVRMWASRAAAVVVLVAAGFLVIDHFDKEPLVHSNTDLLALHDGTSIYLNDGATIFYPEQFDETKRVVELDGEAFFEVAKEESRRFEIKTDLASIIVLGTSFSVDEDDEERVLEVLVRTGKVRVSPNGSEAYVDLVKGQTVRFDAKTGELKRDRAEDMNDIAWHTRTLKWRDAGLKEVISDIETTLSISFDMSNVTPNLQCPFTAFYKDVTIEKLPEILSAIEDVFGIKSVQMTDDKYALSGGECKQAND